MPDITMCSNQRCTLREKCYRYRAVPSERQAYCYFTGGKKCDYFWPVQEAEEFEGVTARPQQ